MNKSNIEEIIKAAKQYTTERTPWHHHFLTSNCQLNSSGKDQIILENEKTGEAFYALFDYAPIEELEHLGKLEIKAIKIENMETMWELQKEVETISKSISGQRFNGVIKKLNGRANIQKHRGRRYSRRKLISYNYLSRDYLVPLDGNYYLRIKRDKDGSLNMWLYDNRTPDKLGISTLLAYEHQPIIARKLKFLIRYLSRHSQSSKNA